MDELRRERKACDMRRWITWSFLLWIALIFVYFHSLWVFERRSECNLALQYAYWADDYAYANALMCGTTDPAVYAGRPLGYTIGRLFLSDTGVGLLGGEKWALIWSMRLQLLLAVVILLWVIDAGTVRLCCPSTLGRVCGLALSGIILSCTQFPYYGHPTSYVHAACMALVFHLACTGRVHWLPFITIAAILNRVDGGWFVGAFAVLLLWDRRSARVDLAAAWLAIGALTPLIYSGSLAARSSLLWDNLSHWGSLWTLLMWGPCAVLAVRVPVGDKLYGRGLAFLVLNLLVCLVLSSVWETRQYVWGAAVMVPLTVRYLEQINA